MILIKRTAAKTGMNHLWWNPKLAGKAPNKQGPARRVAIPSEEGLGRIALSPTFHGLSKRVGNPGRPCLVLM